MKNSVYVIGHHAPPVTGENLCRGYLETTLRELGYVVFSRSRSDWKNLFIGRAQIWLMAGATPLGHFRDFLLLLWWRAWGAKVNVYIHNISWAYFHNRTWFWRWLGRRAFCYVVLTDEIAATLNRAGLPAVRLNNTLPEGREPVADMPREPVRRLLWMSAVTEEKGFIVAYSIFLELRSADKTWIFDIYGGGNLAEFPEKFPEARFHGFVDGVAKQAAFNSGGLLILPSHYRNETQPLAIIEALANGMPFVASDIGGLPAMRGLVDDPAGICLPAASKGEAWIGAINQIMADYSRFAAAAQKTYQRNFSRLAYRAGIEVLMAGK